MKIQAAADAAAAVADAAVAAAADAAPVVVADVVLAAHKAAQRVAGRRSQDKFAARILALGPARVDPAWVERAVARYGQFLLLARDNPGQVVVPTLDIDLVWHAHMLSPDDYADDCRAVVGRVLASFGGPEGVGAAGAAGGEDDEAAAAARRRRRRRFCAAARESLAQEAFVRDSRDNIGAMVVALW